MIYGISSTIASYLSRYLNNFLTCKTVVILGEMGKTLNLILLLCGTYQGHINIPLILISQIIGGIGFSLAITNDTALLKKILENLSLSEQFSTIQSKSQSKMFLSTLVAGFLGGVLYDQQPSWPFIFSIIASTTSVIFILLIDDINDAKPKTTIQKNVISSNKIQLDSNQIFWIFFYAITRTFTITPFLLLYPLYFLYVNVEPLLFGLVLSLFSLSAYFVSKYSGKFTHYFGKKIVMLFMVITMLTGFIILWVSDEIQNYFGIDYFIIGLLSITCLGLGSGAIRPVTMSNLNLRSLSISEQIELFSKMETLFGILNAMMLLVCAFMIDLFYLPVAFFTLALIFSVFVLMLKI